jgi:hypothetical protein
MNDHYLEFSRLGLFLQCKPVYQKIALVAIFWISNWLSIHEALIEA